MNEDESKELRIALGDIERHLIHAFDDDDARVGLKLNVGHRRLLWSAWAKWNSEAGTRRTSSESDDAATAVERLRYLVEAEIDKNESSDA